MGTVRDGRYLKKIDFNRAVLWKTRELSIAAIVAEDWIDRYGIHELVFVDMGKRKIFYVSVKKAQSCWVKKVMHQEAQYYFPVSILKTLPLDQPVQVGMFDGAQERTINS